MTLDQSKALLPETVLTQEEAGFKDLHSKLNSILSNTKIVGELRQDLRLIDGRDRAKLHSHLKTAVQPIVHQILEMLKTQNKEKSVLMPGGWIGEPGGSGHGLAYEFKKDQAGNLLFLVHNSGAGLEKYHETVISETDNKLRYKTVQCYKIPAEKIVDKETLNKTLNFFIAELFKPQIFPSVANKSSSDSVQYDAKELYEHVFRQISHLWGKAIPVRELCLLDPSYNDTESIGQRSGTCAEKSLHELIKHSIADKKVAKLIIFSLKLQATELFLAETHALNKSSDDYAKNLSQLEFGKRKLAKKLSKILKDCYNGTLPYEVQAIQARAQKTIDEVQTLCDEKNKKITYLEQCVGQNASKITNTNVWQVELADAVFPETAKPGKLDQKERQEQQEKKELKDYASEACLGEQFSIDSFKKFCTRLKSLAEESHYEERPYTEIEKQIYSYLTNFPLTPKYFDSIDSPEKAVQYINEIKILLEKYSRAVQQSNDYRDYNQLTPKMVAAILSATEAIDLVYQKFNFIDEGEPRGIEKFFGGTFNTFKKNSRLNPCLATGLPSLDARIQTILNRTERDSEFSKAISLESINAYLNKPKQANLKIYLEKLYGQNIDLVNDNMPRFTEKEKRLIVSKNYQALIAYLHYLELYPGKPPEDFSKDAGNVALYKKMKSVCQKIFNNILDEHQFRDLIWDEGWGGQKFVVTKDDNNYGMGELRENSLIFKKDFKLNKEASIKHFNKIKNRRDVDRSIFLSKNRCW